MTPKTLLALTGTMKGTTSLLGFSLGGVAAATCGKMGACEYECTERYSEGRKRRGEER